MFTEKYMSATAFKEKVSTQLHFKNDKRWGVMRKLLNTLYITNPNATLGRDGENIVVRIDGKEVGRRPIHILEQIVCFNYTGSTT